MITSRPVEGARRRYFWRRLMGWGMLAVGGGYRPRRLELPIELDRALADALVQRPDHAGIELAAGGVEHAPVGDLRRKWAAVRARGGHRLEGVADGEDPGLERD